MRVIIAICVGIFLFLAGVFVALKIYQNQFPQQTTVERWRTTVDVKLRNGYISGSPIVIWINRFIFHNQDKYAWYPPRIIPEFTNESTPSSYIAYGLVTDWDPHGEILTLSSYFGVPLYVRFTPTLNGPIAYMNRFDQFGQVQTARMQIVKSPYVPNWKTVFCQNDVVFVEAKTHNAFLHTSLTSPLLPTVITLVRRLCSQN